jgi:hypothetical protein
MLSRAERATPLATNRHHGRWHPGRWSVARSTGGIGDLGVTNVMGDLGRPTLTDSPGAPYARSARVIVSKE